MIVTNRLPSFIKNNRQIMKLEDFRNKFLALYLPGLVILTVIISGCSGSTPPNDPSFAHAGSDIMKVQGYLVVIRVHSM